MITRITATKNSTSAFMRLLMDTDSDVGRRPGSTAPSSAIRHLGLRRALFAHALAAQQRDGAGAGAAARRSDQQNQQRRCAEDSAAAPAATVHGHRKVKSTSRLNSCSAGPAPPAEHSSMPRTRCPAPARQRQQRDQRLTQQHAARCGACSMPSTLYRPNSRCRRRIRKE